MLHNQQYFTPDCDETFYRHTFSTHPPCLSHPVKPSLLVQCSSPLISMPLRPQTRIESAARGRMMMMEDPDCVMRLRLHGGREARGIL